MWVQDHINSFRTEFFALAVGPENSSVFVDLLLFFRAELHSLSSQNKNENYKVKASIKYVALIPGKPGASFAGT